MKIRYHKLGLKAAAVLLPGCANNPDVPELRSQVVGLTSKQLGFVRLHSGVPTAQQAVVQPRWILL